MFSYGICNQADAEIFQKQCQTLEKHISSIQKGDMLTDVDGSQTQFYHIGDKEVTVHNSRYIGAVYIDSEVDLEQYF